MIEMEIVGVRVEMHSNAPIVLLREKTPSARLLPIFVGMSEATAIALCLEGKQPPRPMTHDLMIQVLGELTADLERIVVTELRDKTFFAEIHLNSSAGTSVISSRPSDAIALAVRSGAAIFVNEDVVGIAGYAGTRGDQQLDSEEVVEQFKEFIDSVSPEDFAQS